MIWYESTCIRSQDPNHRCPDCHCQFRSLHFSVLNASSSAKTQLIVRIRLYTRHDVSINYLIRILTVLEHTGRSSTVFVFLKSLPVRVCHLIFLARISLLCSRDFRSDHRAADGQFGFTVRQRQIWRTEIMHSSLSRSPEAGHGICQSLDGSRFFLNNVDYQEADRCESSYTATANN